MPLLKKPLPTVLGDFAAGDAADFLADPADLQAVRLRRRQLSRMTTAFDLPLAKARLPDTDYHISPKYDGEYTCLVYRDGELLSLNPGGTLRQGAPFHDEALAALTTAGVSSALIGGELFVRHEDGRRTRIHDVTAAVRAPKEQAQLDSLCFAVFNIYSLDGEDLSVSYDKAITAASRIFEGGDRVFAVDTVVGDRKAVFERFDSWVENDVFEGVVIRSEQAGVFKIKPRHSLDLAVLGFSEGQDDRSGMLHSLLVGVVRDERHAQVLARVGGGFSDEERVSLFRTLSKQVVESDYAEVNSERVAYRMVEPGMIIEMSCLELIARTMHGNPIERMVIAWDSKGKRWQGVRRLPLASVRSPQFVRVRDDKSFSEADAGMMRIEDIVSIPAVSRGGMDTLELPKSAILEREVATKIMKEQTLVRKLLLWKTNKDEASREFPAYVLYLTDYSPNRKDPLQYDIAVSSSEEQIRALYAEWREAKFVRGWALQ